MVENFIGATLQVELTNGSSLEGIVSHIDSHTQLLTLKDVTFNSNDGNTEKKAFYGVPGTDIKDLKIIKASYNLNNNIITEPINSNTATSNKAASSSSSSSIYSSTTTVPTSQQNVLLSKSPFSDPAIISYSSQAPNIVSPNNPLIQQENTFYIESQTLKKSSTTTQTTGSIADTDSKGDEEEEIHEEENNYGHNSSSSRNNKPNGFHRGDSSALESDNGMYNHKRPSRRRRNGNSNYYYNYSENHSTRRPRKGRNQTHEWAGGDVNEFKSEEFDFQGNLDLFDKEKVFAEIRQQENTFYIESQTLKKSSTTTQTTGSIADTDSKGDEEEEIHEEENNYGHNSSSSRNNKPNGFHRGDSSALESDNGMYNHKRPSRRRRNGNSNYYYNYSENHSTRRPRKGRNQTHEWAGGDVNEFKSEEFDFQGNLDLFDKEKVFAEIRLASNENVLESSSLKIRTLTGVFCPTVQPTQMAEVERLAAIETGPNEDQMIENAGRGASMMCLQALGGSRRIRPNNHNAAPLVVLLVGNNKTGAYGLATARHLANHGCHVIACVVSKEKDLLKSVALQQKFLLPTGGKVVKTVEGYQLSLHDISNEYDKSLICDLMEWANINKAPVLSLDMPSGVNGNTGYPVNSAHHVRPKWTLCLGAPKNGCRNRSITGELFLADIGIPRVCWKKIGVKGWGMPWGSEYLIGLEYE
ncbi:5064_t:CDS:10 [Entrophospora sp. SA101]|nr:5064_t:CDS:10 [Entrophospora sp. SA101]